MAGNISMSGNSRQARQLPASHVYTGFQLLIQPTIWRWYSVTHEHLLAARQPLQVCRQRLEIHEQVFDERGQDNKTIVQKPWRLLSISKVGEELILF